MSPEQLEGEEIDHRTDLWAVGIMLFQMVTGAHPVIDDDTNLQQALLDITTLELPMPSVGERRHDLGPLAGVIDRCLIKDRAHRTRDAHVLLQELEALSAGRRVAVLGHDGNPFAGLAPFQEADADRFYGRAREVGAVLARLRSCALVALAGPSGVGKSSLVRAGRHPAAPALGRGLGRLHAPAGAQPARIAVRHPVRAGAIGHRSCHGLDRSSRRRAGRDRPRARGAARGARPARRGAARVGAQQAPPRAGVHRSVRGAVHAVR